MDKYQRVEKPRPEVPICENEIRISTQGMPRNYIAYATTLFREKNVTEIVLKAMGNAISKTVAIAEIIKRRIVGLHQITEISSEDIICTWEPLEEGLLPVETTRRVSMITITLSTAPLNTSAPGYQPPLPEDQVKPLPDYEYEEDDAPQTYRNRGRGRGRGTGRGGYQNGDGSGYVNYSDGWYRGRGRGRSRGRGFSARGAGYYGGGDQSANYNDFGSYGPNSAPRARGRGRSYMNTQYDNGNFNDNMRGMDYGQQGRDGRGRGCYNDAGNYFDYGYSGGDGGRRGRGRGRGKLGPSAQDTGYGYDYGDMPSRGRGRGRGRGRARGARTQV